MSQPSGDTVATATISRFVLCRRVLAWFVDAVLIGVISVVLVVCLARYYPDLVTESELVRKIYVFLIVFLIGFLDSLICAGLLLYTPLLAFFPRILEPGTLSTLSIGVVVNWFYHGLTESSPLRATPAKFLFGLKVVQADGSPLKYSQAVKRHLFKWSTVGALFIPAVYLFACNRTQLVHDRLARTIVVPRRIQAHELTPQVATAEPVSGETPLKTAAIPERIYAALIDAVFWSSVQVILVSTAMFVVSRLPLPELMQGPLSDWLSEKGTSWSHGQDVCMLVVVCLVVAPLVMLCAVVLPAVFECSHWQATPGKYVMGAQVTDLEGGSVTFFRALEKQLAQAMVYMSSCSILLVAVFALYQLPNGMADHFGVLAVALSGLFYLVYGGCLCFTFGKGQTVVDRAARRLVVVRDLPNRGSFIKLIVAALIVSALLTNQVRLDPYASVAFRLAPKGPEFAANQATERTVLSGWYGAHYGFIDRTGKEVIAPIYDDSRDFHDGLCAVKLNHRWGYINKKGELIIPARFAGVLDFSEGLAPVKEGAMVGFIDKAGAYVIKPDCWSDATMFEHGVAAVVRGTKIGIIDRTGKYLVKPDLDWTEKYPDGIRLIERDRKFGFLDQYGRLIVEPKYSAVDAFAEAVAPVCENGKWGYLSQSGSMAIAPEFDAAQRFHDGLAVIELDRKFGLINHQGSFVLPPSYAYMAAAYDTPPAPENDLFRSGNLVPIYYNNRWGYADATGKVVIEPRFKSVSTFSQGLASVAMFDSPEDVPITAEAKWAVSVGKNKQNTLAARVFSAAGKRNTGSDHYPNWLEIYAALHAHRDRFSSEEREFLQQWMDDHLDSGWSSSSRGGGNSLARRIYKDAGSGSPSTSENPQWTQIYLAFKHHPEHYTELERAFLTKWSESDSLPVWDHSSGKSSPSLRARVFKAAGDRNFDESSDPDWEEIYAAVHRHSAEFSEAERAFLQRWSEQNVSSGWDHTLDADSASLEMRFNDDTSNDTGELDARTDKRFCDSVLRAHPERFSDSERAFIKMWFATGSGHRNGGENAGSENVDSESYEESPACPSALN